MSPDVEGAVAALLDGVLMALRNPPPGGPVRIHPLREIPDEPGTVTYTFIVDPKADA